MTVEEAITILRKDRDLCLFNPMTGEEKPMNEDCRLSAEALTLAIEALEKQTPKKPVKSEYLHSTPHGEEFAEMYTCPNCRKNRDLVELSRYKDDFCHRCGTAIDWSESD